MGMALLVFQTVTAYGQSTFGAVVGVVTDAQSAMAPAGPIKLTETRTNLSRSTQTTNQGTYEFVLEESQTGFAVFKTQEFEVAARQTVRIGVSNRRCRYATLCRW